MRALPASNRRARSCVRARVARAGAAVVVASFLGACESASAPEIGDASSATAAGGSEATRLDAGGGDAAAGAVSESDAGAGFAQLYETLFTPFCARPCHAGGTAGLDMSSREAAYRSLVRVPANPKAPCGDSGKNRVEPGAPFESLLVLKLSTKGAPCGQQMPPGGELREEFQSAIREWIAAGALDN